MNSLTMFPVCLFTSYQNKVKMPKNNLKKQTNKKNTNIQSDGGKSSSANSCLEVIPQHPSSQWQAVQFQCFISLET